MVERGLKEANFYFNAKFGTNFVKLIFDFFVSGGMSGNYFKVLKKGSAPFSFYVLAL